MKTNKYKIYFKISYNNYYFNILLLFYLIKNILNK